MKKNRKYLIILLSLLVLLSSFVTIYYYKKEKGIEDFIIEFYRSDSFKEYSIDNSFEKYENNGTLYSINSNIAFCSYIVRYIDYEYSNIFMEDNVLNLQDIQKNKETNYKFEKEMAEKYKNENIAITDVSFININNLISDKKLEQIFKSQNFDESLDISEMKRNYNLRDYCFIGEINDIEYLFENNKVVVIYKNLSGLIFDLSADNLKFDELIIENLNVNGNNAEANIIRYKVNKDNMTMIIWEDDISLTKKSFRLKNNWNVEEFNENRRLYELKVGDEREIWEIINNR